MLSRLLEKYILVDIGGMRASDFLANQERVEMKKLKYVREGHGWKTVDHCPVCDSRDYKHKLEKYGIPLVKCKNCELRFHTKIPADPNDIYQTTDYTVYSKGETEEHFNYRRERFGRERVRLLEEHCGDLSDKTLLDVGCGNGYFLAAAKEVCKRCVGSEFSAHLRELAQEKTGVTIYSEPLEEFPERNFDIITVFDVIEHIPAPVSLMQAAANLLTPGGHILLCTLPILIASA
ncbi:MAG: methyltransferase domain-containing protein [Candidatus Marinimicrobia bacterium]|nr:methyltransferase domain-containing protein [Candidatus Neomarinimicrobiota bacterium]